MKALEKFKLRKEAGRCLNCGSLEKVCKNFCDNCLQRRLWQQRQRRLEARRAVYDHYSGGRNRCACCNQQGELFLSIDHIIPVKESKVKRMSYEQIVKAGFPPGLQILCMNCNVGRQRNGGICPHEKILPEKSGECPELKTIWPIEENHEKRKKSISLAFEPV